MKPIHVFLELLCALLVGVADPPPKPQAVLAALVKLLLAALGL